MGIPDRESLEKYLLEQVQFVMARYVGQLTSLDKADGSVVTEVDLALQKGIAGKLYSLWPDIPFLGEEMTSEEQQALMSTHQGLLWCLDPLDGTSNFATSLPFYSVSLALLLDGEVVMGIVIDPERKEVFSAERDKGAYCNGKRIARVAQKRPMKSCIANVDFKRLDKPFARSLVTDLPFRSQRNLGSCALEFCWLALDRFQLYLHGGMKLWDYAAGLLILHEAGGFSSTLEGEVVMADHPGSRSVVAANREDLFNEWSDRLKILKNNSA